MFFSLGLSMIQLARTYSMNTVTVYNTMKGLTWFEVRQRVNAWPGVLRWGAEDLKKEQEKERRK